MGIRFYSRVKPHQERGRYGDRRYTMANNSMRSPSFRQYGIGRSPGIYENQPREYRTMPNNYRATEEIIAEDMGRRFPQPKRIRFSDFLQRQNSNSSGGQSGSTSPQRHFSMERKGSRIFNQSTNPDNHINQNMNYRGSKRQRENETPNTPLSGATSIEPSLSRMNVSTPPEMGYQPMPPKKQN